MALQFNYLTPKIKIYLNKLSTVYIMSIFLQDVVSFVSVLIKVLLLRICVYLLPTMTTQHLKRHNFFPVRNNTYTSKITNI